MIEAKYRYENEEKWNYNDYESEERALEEFQKDPKKIVDYKFRQKSKIKNYLTNLKNTKKNWKKVRASPYASLAFALKARKIIIALLIPFILYRIYDMLSNFNGSGVMGVFQKLVMIGIGIYVCWKLYSTIPQAKKQIEYYKKYPHTINYCPTNTKETVDDIFKKIQDNKEKGVNKNGTRN